jgi:carbon storage regulator CsrA
VLVIKRKPNTSFRVGEAIVRILDIEANGDVKIGVEAPREVEIFRAEIDPRIKGAKK